VNGVEVLCRGRAVDGRACPSLVRGLMGSSCPAKCGRMVAAAAGTSLLPLHCFVHSQPAEVNASFVSLLSHACLRLPPSLLPLFLKGQLLASPCHLSDLPLGVPRCRPTLCTVGSPHSTSDLHLTRHLTPRHNVSVPARIWPHPNSGSAHQSGSTGSSKLINSN
jgi:hypothetical protein